MSQSNPPRVALYARFSSDLQRQTSIEDQLRAARARALVEGWPVVIERRDEQVSGSVPFAMRPGSKGILADALADRFDVLIIEGLDRTFRDLADQEHVVKRLEHRGIRIIGTADGYDTAAGKQRRVMRVFRGLLNETYLEDLREKTHRGLTGQFERGLSAGGRTYGYRTVEAPGGRKMVIDEDEAAHVRWVFEQIAEGRSPRAVVIELNERGIKSARGGTWAVSAIVGSAVRGLGMLNNELYVGRVIWNRRQWLKDPDTGRRRCADRPESEWQQRLEPALRIVPAALWDHVHSASRNGPSRGARAGRGAGPKSLFGGLLRCPACNGAIVVTDAKHYGCSVHKDRGDAVCANRLTWRRIDVDRRLLAEVRDGLLEPAAIAEMRTMARSMVAEATRDAQAGERSLVQRRAEIAADVDRLVDVLGKMGHSAAIAQRLRDAEAELRRMEVAPAPTAAADVNALIDQVVAGYRRTMLQLAQALDAHETDRQRTRQILADLLGPVTLFRDGETGESYAELIEPADRLLLSAVGADGSGCEGAHLFPAAGRRRIFLTGVSKYDARSKKAR